MLTAGFWCHADMDSRDTFKKSPEVPYSYPQNISKAPSQDIFGCLRTCCFSLYVTFYHANYFPSCRASVNKKVPQHLNDPI